MAIGKERMNDDNKKLTRVVSTKLSIEDDNFLQQLTIVAYRDGTIKEPTKSELIRFLVTNLLFSIRQGMRQELDKQSLLSQKSEEARNIT